MKTYVKKGVFCMAAMLFSLSCTKELDEIRPQQSIDSDIALQTSSGVVNTLLGA